MSEREYAKNTQGNQSATIVDSPARKTDDAVTSTLNLNCCRPHGWATRPGFLVRSRHGSSSSSFTVS